MPHNQWMADEHRVSPFRAVAALVAMVAVMLLVAALGEWVLIPSSWVREIDEGGVAWGGEQLAAHPGLHDAAVHWAFLSGPWFVHPAVMLLAGGLAACRRITVRAAVVTVLIGLIGWGLGAVCKEIVDRPRPLDAVVEVGSWSYPSGHTTNIALGSVLIIALAQYVRAAWIRWGATVLVLIGAALTTADRVLLGVHYVSDVAMGLVLGAAVALVGLAGLPSSPAARPHDRWVRPAHPAARPRGRTHF